MRKVAGLRIAAALIVAACVCSGLFAQSNDFLDEFLKGDAPGVKSVLYMVLVSTDMMSEDAGIDRAFALSKELEWIQADRQAESPVTLAEYSYFVMRAFGKKGGMMYSMFPSPRYAYRELLYYQMIQGRTDPDNYISGTQAMRIMGRCLAAWGH